MNDPACKTYGELPTFRPEDGTSVLQPEQQGAGYWVGAPTVLRDTGAARAGERWLLCYRRRRPRGHESDRGYVTAIAESADGVSFEDILQVRKEELGSTSIEKCCLQRAPDGDYLYYLSYVDREDQRWRIDVVKAPSIAALDIAQRRPVLTAATASAATGHAVEGVKDPNVYRVGGVYYMFLSFAEGSPETENDRQTMHATSDVYNTGILTAPSALATSTDGLSFTWEKKNLSVGAAGTWDSYQSRISTIFQRAGIWYSFYDGSASVEENYEERLSVAHSFDLSHWRKASVEGPLVTVPYGTGSVRYADVVADGDQLYVYYEVVLEDGSHELRRGRVE